MIHVHAELNQAENWRERSNIIPLSVFSFPYNPLFCQYTHQRARNNLVHPYLFIRWSDFLFFFCQTFRKFLIFSENTGLGFGLVLKPKSLVVECEKETPDYVSFSATSPLPFLPLWNILNSSTPVWREFGLLHQKEKKKKENQFSPHV